MLRVDPDGAGFSITWLGEGEKKIVLPKSPLLLERSASNLPSSRGVGQGVCPSVLALSHPCRFAAMRESEENCAVGALGSQDDFLPNIPPPCPTRLPWQGLCCILGLMRPFFTQLMLELC